MLKALSLSLGQQQPKLFRRMKNSKRRMSQCETNALYRIWSSDCRVVDAVKRVVRIVVDMSGDVGERRFQ
ncbi:hypothetical protein Tco_1037645 [Tanacetum coccineum]